MPLDETTPCLACPDVVHTLFAAATVILNLWEGSAASEREFNVAVGDLRAAVNRLSPFVEAHFENQAHAYSEALTQARHPESPAVVVPARVLPFPTDR